MIILTRPITTFAIALVWLLGAAQACAWSPALPYPVRLDAETGGLDIGVQTYTGVAVVVSLHNRSVEAASCAAAFQYYPHGATPDEIRSTRIGPGQRKTLSYPARRFGAFSTAFVTLRCAAADTGKDPRERLLAPQRDLGGK